MATVSRNYSSNDVLNLLPKCSDLDSDIRFMTLVDLNNILNAQGLFIIDYSTAAKATDALMLLLDDTNGDVQSQALKCIGPLAAKSPSEILCPLIERLTRLETPHSMDASLPATATRALVQSLSRPVTGTANSKTTQDAYYAVSKILIPRLLGTFIFPVAGKLPQNSTPAPAMLDANQQKGANVDAIDLLNDVVQCFGPMLQEAEVQALKKKLQEILDDEKTGNVGKKKTVLAISNLAVFFTDSQLSAFVSSTIESFRSVHLSPLKRRLLLSTIGSMSRTIPSRLAPNLQMLAPFVLGAVSQNEYEELTANLDEEGSVIPVEEEVKEAALIALEELLSCCGGEMRLFTDESIDAGIRFLGYDPATVNHSDDEEMGNTQDEEEVEDDEQFDKEDEDFEEEGGMSDGDDTSWKVRRCAAKVLHSIISTRGSGDLMDNGTLYEKIAPVLIKRFNEREENVRLEIISVLSLLIKKTGAGLVTTNFPDDDFFMSTSQNSFSFSRKRRRGDSDLSMLENHMVFRNITAPPEVTSPTSGPRADLSRLGPSLVRAAVKLLKQKSVPTKEVTTTLIREFIHVQHGGLADQLDHIIDPLMECIALSSTSSGGTSIVSAGGTVPGAGNNLRIESLRLLRTLCDTHSSAIINPYMKQIVPVLTAAIKDKHLKSSSEATSVAESVVKSLVTSISPVDERAKGFVEDLFDTIVNKVSATDTDLDVRRRAIHALGTVLALTSGSSKYLSLTKRLNGLEALGKRLKNETTRVSSVQAIEIVIIATADKNELKEGWVNDVALELANQLRKSDRTLRASSLSALRCIAANPIALSYLSETSLKIISRLILPLLQPQSLGILGLAMTVLADLVKSNPEIIVDEALNEALCSIVVLPLAGSTFEVFLNLVAVIGTFKAGQALMQDFLKKVGVAGDPAIVGSAIGTLIASGGSSVGVGIDDIVHELKTAQDDQRKCLALSVLGETGLRLGSSSPIKPDLFLEYFKSKSDKVPRTAAIALGRAGAGNTPVYLPLILSTMKKKPSHQVLLLHSTKEILQHASKQKLDISSYTSEIWGNLLEVSETEDNRAVGAECIGRLLTIEPKKYLPLLQGYLKDPSPEIHGVIIQAVRFAFSDSDESFDAVLRPLIVDMLITMLSDSEMENRRLALTTLNSATNNKAPLILPQLSRLLPFVTKESEINPVLVREVQMGPFKIKVDDGLEIRKSAYETLHALMDTAFSRMNLVELFDRVIAGLSDDHDIKMLCNLMLTKLIVLAPSETSLRLDAIAERFKATLGAQLKDNAVKQEVEKAFEASKDVLRVTVRLQNAYLSITGPRSQHVWKSYWEFVSKEWKGQLQVVESEMRSQR